MKALIVEPGKPPAEIEIENDCIVWQEIVGGPVSTAMPYDDNIMVLFNDVGISLNLPPNQIINGQIMPGTFLITGERNGDVASLTPSQIQEYTAMFAIPDAFSPAGHWKVWHEESTVAGWYCLRILSDWGE